MGYRLVTWNTVAVFGVVGMVGCANDRRPSADSSALRAAEADTGSWLSGDLHTHTFLTDGSHTQTEVVQQAFGQFGLDWLANSEHGGQSTRDETGHQLSQPEWRWRTLRDRSFPLIQTLRTAPVAAGRLLVQGLEWNCPGHEHVSVGIADDEPRAISDFEYVFDAKDKDSSRSEEGLSKYNTTPADALAALEWLAETYPNTSYAILNHPSRKQTFSAADLRAFNDAAPDTCFGLEGLPGHQKQPWRGGYDNGPFVDPTTGEDRTFQARTYGGADFMIARLGGLWDALLAEGRRFFTFANSDFHSAAADADFWPGEYSRTWVFVKDLPGTPAGLDAQDLVGALRSGRSFVVHGDLIDALEVQVRTTEASATLGQTLVVRPGEPVEVVVRFHSPRANGRGDSVTVHHIDLIQGPRVARAEPGSAAYSQDSVDGVRIAKQLTAADWSMPPAVCGGEEETSACGWREATVTLGPAAGSFYLRLRGANLAPGVPGETDAEGNPLMDEATTTDGTNTADKAWADLWFYSNPIFVVVDEELVP